MFSSGGIRTLETPARCLDWQTRRQSLSWAAQAVNWLAVENNQKKLKPKLKKKQKTDSMVNAWHRFLYVLFYLFSA